MSLMVNDAATADRPASHPGKFWKRTGAAASCEPNASDTYPWQRHACWVLGMTSALLLWSAFPPLGWSWLAWVAPVAWVLLIRLPKLHGRRPYAVLWLAGFVHWLLVVHWVRLPHWSTFFGWLALAMYLASYIPLFVGLARIAVHRLRIPVLIAAPVVWTGLELLRGHLLTGFSMALLAHTQVEHLKLIQISDVTGAYGVSFLVMFAATGLARMIPIAAEWLVLWPLVPVGAVMAGVVGYGASCLTTPAEGQSPAATAHVALIQGSVDVTFENYDPRKAVEHYLDLSCDTVASHPGLDAVVWPESMCTFLAPLVTYDKDAPITPKDRQWADEKTAIFHQRLRVLVDEHRQARVGATTGQQHELPSFIVCSGTFRLDRELQQYNTGFLIGPAGRIVSRYDKMHPVMFGEYLPLGNWFPWLYEMTPLWAGLSAGSNAVPFHVKDLTFCPSICFESTVPHLIRRQVEQLTRAGTPPNVLVNLTNDGWFWGSSELDLHLACGVFRAVENRLPMLIAANTGFSAWIDASGRILQQGPRRATGVVLAHVMAERRTSLYRAHGDLFGGVCLLASAVVSFLGTVAGLLRRGSKNQVSG